MKVYFDSRSNLLLETRPFLDLTNNLLESSIYLTWNSVVNPQLMNIKIAQEYGKKVFLYNHGLYGHEDHCPHILDIHTNVCGVPMIADKYLCWGPRDYNDLIKAGYPKEKLAIVGFSGMWESVFSYKLETGRTLITSYCAGETIQDPKTKIKGALIARDHQIPKQHEKAKWILYIPSHDIIERHLVHTRKVYELLKDTPDLIIKACSQYVGLDDKNPFKDEKDYNYCGKCDKLITAVDTKWKKCDCGADMPIMPKVTYTSINSPDNLAKLRNLIRESKVVITDYIGTPSLICYAIGVPCITFKNDYGLRELNKDGEYVMTNHETEADIIATPENLMQTIQDVISGKINKKKEMSEAAEELGGVSYGWPTQNILRELECL